MKHRIVIPPDALARQQMLFQLGQALKPERGGEASKSHRSGGAKSTADGAPQTRPEPPPSAKPD